MQQDPRDVSLHGRIRAIQRYLVPETGAALRLGARRRNKLPTARLVAFIKRLG